MSSGYEGRRLALKAIKQATAALDAEGAAMAAAANLITTPNVGVQPANISPAPSLIALMDFTPTAGGSGLVLVTYMLRYQEPAADTVTTTMLVGEHLTTITGGTASGVAGLTLEPTSFTSDSPQNALGDNQSPAGAGLFVAKGMGILNLTPGVRCALALQASSGSARAWTNLLLWCSASELAR